MSQVLLEDIARLPKPFQDFWERVSHCIPVNRRFCDPLYTLAYGIDASFYRLIPKIVLKARTPEEITKILRASQEYKVPVTFRTAGTSLSGQAVTDSVLVVLQGAWRGHSILDEGEKIVLEPGIVGAEANRFLTQYARKIGPDPASIDHAMIGGMAANNASGMCCGTADNSYKTVAEMKIIFGDGTMLDTGNLKSCSDFLNSKAEWVSKISEIRDEIMSDPQLVELIHRKYKIKNTTGYSLNAFVDFTDPIEIIKHLMIGSEGTLGFISEITYNTVIEHAHKASALIIYADMEQACLAVQKLDRETVSAAELMDRISLKTMEDKPGMPEYLKALSPTATALLIEVRGADHEFLEQKIKQVADLLKEIPTVFPISFTAVKAEYENLWNIRKGIFPAVGAIRELGTGVIIEDVAFPKENLAEATLALREILDKYAYPDAIIYGHALDGNLHFVFTQDFGHSEDLPRYEGLMRDVSDLVVSRFGGSLKAEHGTGRNMAPFVEQEWGKKAYILMKRLKAAFDPENLLNPGVIINDDPHSYLENLKNMPQAHKIIDTCTNCGFCQNICTSKNLTLTPRQRIVIQREIQELKRTGQEPERLSRLEKDFDYPGNKTCAVDGLCATTCPLGINTGDYVKFLRSQSVTPTTRWVAESLANHMGGVTSVMRLGLGVVNGAHGLLGTKLMESLTQGARKISGNAIPLWNPWMPKGGKVPFLKEHKAKTLHTNGSSSPLKVVYFPSCISRSMGTAKNDRDQRALSEAMLSVLTKAGCEVISLPKMNGLCCGMPWESKGFFETADRKSKELEEALFAASGEGSYPVLCDTSPCLYRMKRVMHSLKLYEPVEFIYDFLLDRLAFTQSKETIALHVTCSSIKMNLKEKFYTVAHACAEEVIMPEDVHCCGFAGDRGFTFPELNRSALAALKETLPDNCRAGYSNSRTCEIGLSLHSGISYQSIVYLVDKCTKSI
ncbi:FAD-binding and (Fe-S)-binding domain-containing protein [Desulfosporosinus sp. PR]|uniref:FAD-binding and (Fe-S)-binding domain-containing protein n=1 Tax=Candidatus Desulfosporosinus nitrosoreducens TaxID=3401928 RepID=UPI0027F51928|nr:FAD-binding and (Fe-S)-binding domain-containing protein [Desulfosporosinus sp. PR]MDQ7093192.1 FAD-binding and (Fe-S)-binding domain-containing protein [Desulfosporosinus sp. PR]